jgi:ribosomal RNA-processing protein 9
MGSHQLFSGSTDRTVKVWNLDQMAYVDTLFGHQSEVTSLSSLYRDRALSAGSDMTVRLWKIAEESQLLHRGQTASIDCVAFINEERYFSGSQDGSVSLWRSDKKSPAHVIKNAHGSQWVTSVAALPFTDLVASGSSDGVIRLWYVGSYLH